MQSTNVAILWGAGLSLDVGRAEGFCMPLSRVSDIRHPSAVVGSGLLGGTRATKHPRGERVAGLACTDHVGAAQMGSEEAGVEGVAGTGEVTHVLDGGYRHGGHDALVAQDRRRVLAPAGEERRLREPGERGAGRADPGEVEQVALVLVRGDDVGPAGLEQGEEVVEAVVLDEPRRGDVDRDETAALVLAGDGLEGRLGRAAGLEGVGGDVEDLEVVEPRRVDRGQSRVGPAGGEHRALPLLVDEQDDHAGVGGGVRPKAGVDAVPLELLAHDVTAEVVTDAADEPGRVPRAGERGDVGRGTAAAHDDLGPRVGPPALRLELPDDDVLDDVADDAEHYVAWAAGAAGAAARAAATSQASRMLLR